MLAPIALFGYNRPNKFATAVTSLSENYLAIDSDLFIFIDGAKLAKDKILVNEVTKLARKVSGFNSIEVITHSENKGLANSIRFGVNFILNKFDRLIVIEDDLILSKSFLSYMNSGLEHYKDDLRVASIQGFQYPIKKEFDQPLVLKGADCWGWATWRDRWNSTSFDPQMLMQELIEKNLTHDFDMSGTMPFFQMLKNAQANKIDSWAIFWHASMFVQGKVSIYPKKTLVYNSGHDGSGTHGTRSSIFNTKLSEWSKVENWPIPIENNLYNQSMIKFYRTKLNKKSRFNCSVLKHFIRSIVKIKY